MRTVDLQRRVAGERADELLDRLQASVPEARGVRWDESGHARIELAREREDAREYLAAELDALGEDWIEHIAIL
jgi:spore coat protein CotH